MKKNKIKKQFETMKNDQKKLIKNKNFNKKIKIIASGTLSFIMMIVIICFIIHK